MKKAYIFILAILVFAGLPGFAQIHYTITFTGSGASSTVGDVMVENLVTGVKVTVPAGNALILTDNPTAVKDFSIGNESISIFPNPGINGKSTLSFFAKQSGNVQINAFSIDGGQVAGIDQYLQPGLNSFQLSLPGGAYIIQVVGNGYSYNTKVITQGTKLSKAGIVYTGTERSASSGSLKNATAVTEMIYASNQRLLFTGISGDYKTVYVDTPSSDETIDFAFYACTDGSGNNYKVVDIGGQIWMAENLRTTKYNDGTDVPLGTSESWPYLTSEAYIPNPNHADRVFYNWYAANNPKIAPTGWHVPTMDEWGAFKVAAANIIGDGDTISVGISDVHGWKPFDGMNRPGSDTIQNNVTGFSVIPTGYYGGVLMDEGVVQVFWSSDEMDVDKGNCNNMWNNYWDLYQFFGAVKSEGDNIRCVMDVQ